MLKRLRDGWNTRVNFLDFLKGRIQLRRNDCRLKIGFCSIFPPFPNGAAASNYYLMRELVKRKDIDMYLIPVKNKIDKKLFSFMHPKFANVNSSHLDAIIFFGLGETYMRYGGKAVAKKIAWQTMHDPPGERPLEKETVNQIKNADCVVTLTKWARRCYAREVKGVQYVPHGVDTSIFYQKDDTKPRVFTCLFVSRINYYKGIMPFLDAIPLILEQDASIFFRIVAPIDAHSPHRGEIMGRLKEIVHKYPDNIHLTTSWIPYDQIPSGYQSSSVLIFPSNNEGFGLPLIEAMSTGLPCIVLDKKPMNEVVINGVTGFCLKGIKDATKYHGFVFPDPQQIADKVILFKKNPQLLRAVGRDARKRVVQEYNIVDVVDHMVGFCHAVCRGKK